MNWACGVIVFGLGLAASGQTTHPVHKAASTAHTHKTLSKTTSRTTTIHSLSKGRSRTRGRSAKARVPAGPSYQTHPDPERYQQIQQALADRGYFKGQVNGTWDSDSVDALQRFQADQKLDDDGKISALTLRGLGLGPKHDGTGAASAPAATAVPATPDKAQTTIPPLNAPTAPEQ